MISDKELLTSLSRAWLGKRVVMADGKFGTIRSVAMVDPVVPRDENPALSPLGGKVERVIVDLEEGGSRTYTGVSEIYEIEPAEERS